MLAEAWLLLPHLLLRLLQLLGDVSDLATVPSSHRAALNFKFSVTGGSELHPAVFVVLVLRPQIQILHFELSISVSPVRKQAGFKEQRQNKQSLRAWCLLPTAYREITCFPNSSLRYSADTRIYPGNIPRLCEQHMHLLSRARNTNS